MKKILFFDLETSGIDFYESSIIEFGALLYEIDGDNLKKIREEDVFVNIGYPLSEDIIKLTHITDELLLEKGISEYELFRIVDDMIDEDTILSAYNIQFDITFLMSLYRKYKQSEFVFRNDVLDVLALYKDLYPYPHRLKDAILTFNIEVKNTHRAIDDIKATVLVLEEIKKIGVDVKRYFNIVGYHQEYGIAGIRLPHVLYIVQKGGQKEIQKYKQT